MRNARTSIERASARHTAVYVAAGYHDGRTGLTKTDIQPIPYRGLSQAMNDLLAGQFDSMFDQVVSATPHIAAKSVKPIVVTIPKRSASQPDIPSAAESGWPQLEAVVWTGLFLPKGTPRPIVDRVNTALNLAMKDAGIAKKFADLGADLPAPGAERTPEALGKLVQTEVDKWVPVIKAAGVSMD